MPYNRIYQYLAATDIGLALPMPYQAADAKPFSQSHSTPPSTPPTVDDETLERILTRVTLPLYGLEPVEALQTAHRLSLKERIARPHDVVERRWLLLLGHQQGAWYAAASVTVSYDLVAQTFDLGRRTVRVPAMRQEVSPSERCDV